MWLFDLVFPQFCKSDMLSMAISKYLRESLGLWDNESWLSAGVILEGNLGEKVSLSWLTSPYLELREKWKCIEYIRKSKIWTKTSPWNPETVAKLLPLWKLSDDSWTVLFFYPEIHIKLTSCSTALFPDDIKMPAQEDTSCYWLHKVGKRLLFHTWTAKVQLSLHIWSGPSLFVEIVAIDFVRG